MRPIDADALLQKIEEWDSQLRSFTRYTDRIALDVLCGVVDEIEDADTLDYAPKKQWISVKDRLPEFRDWVLVIGKFVPEGYWIVPHIAEFRNGVWHSDDIDCTPLEERALTVTHWMPLPEPPKEDFK